MTEIIECARLVTAATIPAGRIEPDTEVTITTTDGEQVILSGLPDDVDFVAGEVAATGEEVVVAYHPGKVTRD